MEKPLLSEDRSALPLRTCIHAAKKNASWLVEQTKHRIYAHRKLSKSRSKPGRIAANCRLFRERSRGQDQRSRDGRLQARSLYLEFEGVLHASAFFVSAAPFSPICILNESVIGVDASAALLFLLAQ